MNPYGCPKCHNKSRFHIIEQNPRSVKLDPHTGEIVSQIDELDMLSLPYSGESMRVECAVCGLNDRELLFVKGAQRI